MRRGEARAFQRKLPIRHKHPIAADFALRFAAVAAFNHHGLHTGFLQDAGGAFGVGIGLDVDAGERFGFGQVGREHVGQRQQMPFERGHGVLLQQRRTALGHHHRIEYQPAKRFACQFFRYAFNHFGRT